MLDVIDVRPVTDEDRDLLWLIHCTAMRPAVEATWGWDEPFQRRYFEEHWGTTFRQVIRFNGQDVGMLSYESRPDHLFLGNIALLPAFQGRGIGAKVIRDIMSEARRRGVAVRLQVLKANRARRLYERLGFEADGETTTHVQMSLHRHAE